jgi:secreted Zn-dependent insulinase-like peptidase
VDYLKSTQVDSKETEIEGGRKKHLKNDRAINLLNEMNDRTFKQIKKSVYDNLLDKDNSLLDMAGKYINEILITNYL